jgi:protocatechuate 3,4-dioxygenase beta subunit
MPSRRTFVLGGLGTLFLAACSGGDDDDAAPTTTEAPPPTTPPDDETTTTGTTALPPSDPTTLTPSDFGDISACLVLPEEVEGPYYLDEDLARRDLTEGQAGHALRLGLLVVDAQCAPIPDAAVDVWHADAAGDYSGFGAAGSTTTFLRGTQVTDRNGIVEYRSIFPGWYQGRTVHVHIKVHLEEAVVLTTQLVFDDSLVDSVFAEAPYSARGERDTRNDDDPIVGDWPTNGTLLTTRDDDAGAGTLALAVVGVDPSAGGGSTQSVL